MLMVHVNGKDYEVEQDTKLMRFLRDDLRLTSVKDGCSQGACGTCTVLVDGKATRACIPMLSKLQGKTVVTVEGLSEREKEVYAYAFAKVGAVQCGFCIPGMVMCAKGLLDQNPDPSRVEARQPFGIISAAVPDIKRSSRRSCSQQRCFGKIFRPKRTAAWSLSGHRSCVWMQRRKFLEPGSIRMMCIWMI